MDHEQHLRSLSEELERQQQTFAAAIEALQGAPENVFVADETFARIERAFAAIPREGRAVPTHGIRI